MSSPTKFKPANFVDEASTELRNRLQQASCSRLRTCALSPATS
jgi:hypothetical protein